MASYSILDHHNGQSQSNLPRETISDCQQCADNLDIDGLNSRMPRTSAYDKYLLNLIIL